MRHIRVNHLAKKRQIVPYTICLFLAIIFSTAIWGHGNGWTHVAEMYSVLPFKAEENGFAVKENRDIQDWLYFISSKLIDNYKGVPIPEFGGKCFYDYLRDEFDFHCKHRLLFHWGFNARPWSNELDKKIQNYVWYSEPEKVDRIKKTFIIEQSRRNRLANSKTEKVFGFCDSGKEASWANGIVSIIYDVHLLGDFVIEDNSDFDGVALPTVVAGDIINALRRIDNEGSKELSKEIRRIVKSDINEHEKASKLITVLQEKLPQFLLIANDGALKQKFLSKGYQLK